MPLLGLRPLDSEKEIRRRSTLDLTNFFRINTHLPQTTSSTTDLQAESTQKITVAQTSGRLGSGSEIADGDDTAADNETGSPDSPPIQRMTSSHRRFSKLKFRHASDSQLSMKAKRQAEHTPPMPAMPIKSKHFY